MSSTRISFPRLVLRSRVWGIACLAALVGTPVGASPAAAAPPAGLSTCVACHGAQGEGSSSGIPRLAGQDPGYLSKSLAAFKAGTRASATMQPIAGTLDDAQIAALAAWFATQQAARVETVAGASPDQLRAGEQLAQRGSADVPACFACHGAQGEGNGARFPRLAGQPASYVAARLREFQLRAQQTTPQPGSMTAVAALLSPQQLEDAAAYLATLDR